MAKVTPEQIAVLRRLVNDGDFRSAFSANPLQAVADAKINISSTDLSKLEQVKGPILEQFTKGVKSLAQPGARAEGTHTLVYAIVVALLLE